MSPFVPFSSGGTVKESILGALPSSAVLFEAARGWPVANYGHKVIDHLGIARLLAVTDPRQPGANPMVAVPAFPDAVEAAARCGRAGELGEQFAAFEGWALALPTGAHLALLARCQALLGKRSPEEAFGEAIEHALAVPPFQQARTELLYGEWLRGHLRTALETFRALGAAPWAERAEAELRATGETARRRDVSAAQQLTPQELQVAGLVTGGLTNKEIAAQLFLSPRTVDYHLRKVFTKLGITSRAELIRDGLPQRGLA